MINWAQIQEKALYFIVTYLGKAMSGCTAVLAGFDHLASLLQSPIQAKQHYSQVQARKAHL